MRGVAEHMWWLGKWTTFAACVLLCLPILIPLVSVASFLGIVFILPLSCTIVGVLYFRTVALSFYRKFAIGCLSSANNVVARNSVSSPRVQKFSNDNYDTRERNGPPKSVAVVEEKTSEAGAGGEQTDQRVAGNHSADTGEDVLVDDHSVPEDRVAVLDSGSTNTEDEESSGSTFQVGAEDFEDKFPISRSDQSGNDVEQQREKICAQGSDDASTCEEEGNASGAENVSLLEASHSTGVDELPSPPINAGVEGEKEVTLTTIPSSAIDETSIEREKTSCGFGNGSEDRRAVTEVYCDGDENELRGEQIPGSPEHNGEENNESNNCDIHWDATAASDMAGSASPEIESWSNSTSTLGDIDEASPPPMESFRGALETGSESGGGAIDVSYRTASDEFPMPECTLDSESVTDEDEANRLANPEASPSHETLSIQSSSGRADSCSYDDKFEDTSSRQTDCDSQIKSGPSYSGDVDELPQLPNSGQSEECIADDEATVHDNFYPDDEANRLAIAGASSQCSSSPATSVDSSGMQVEPRSEGATTEIFYNAAADEFPDLPTTSAFPELLTPGSTSQSKDYDFQPSAEASSYAATASVESPSSRMPDFLSNQDAIDESSSPKTGGDTQRDSRPSYAYDAAADEFPDRPKSLQSDDFNEGKTWPQSDLDPDDEANRLTYARDSVVGSRKPDSPSNEEKYGSAVTGNTGSGSGGAVTEVPGDEFPDLPTLVSLSQPDSPSKPKDAIDEWSSPQTENSTCGPEIESESRVSTSEASYNAAADEFPDRPRSGSTPQYENCNDDDKAIVNSDHHRDCEADLLGNPAEAPLSPVKVSTESTSRERPDSSSHEDSTFDKSLVPRIDNILCSSQSGAGSEASANEISYNAADDEFPGPAHQSKDYDSEDRTSKHPDSDGKLNEAEAFVQAPQLVSQEPTTGMPLDTSSSEYVSDSHTDGLEAGSNSLDEVVCQIPDDELPDPREPGYTLEAENCHAEDNTSSLSNVERERSANAVGIEAPSSPGMESTSRMRVNVETGSETEGGGTEASYNTAEDEFPGQLTPGSTFESEAEEFPEELASQGFSQSCSDEEHMNQVLSRESLQIREEVNEMKLIVGDDYASEGQLIDDIEELSEFLGVDLAPLRADEDEQEWAKASINVLKAVVGVE